MHTLVKGTRFSYGYPHLILDSIPASFEMEISLRGLEYIINLRQKNFPTGHHSKHRKGEGNSISQTRCCANGASSGMWKYEQGSSEALTRYCLSLSPDFSFEEVALEQGLGNLFCKEPKSISFRLCGPYLALP